MRYNVYDFDKTIYDGDSTVEFYKYCIKKYPAALLALPKTALYYFIYKAKRCSKTRFKEVFYRFLKYVPDIEENISAFWRIHQKNIKSWYLDCRRDSDIIISASPYFLLEPICHQLHTGPLLASLVELQTGKTLGENCYGKEKVRRLKEAVPDFEIEKFYSDSYSDSPLAQLAQESFLVRKDELLSWDKNEKKLEKI